MTHEIAKDKITQTTLRLYTSEILPSAFKLAIVEDQKTLTEFEKIIRYLPYSNLHLKIEYLVVAKEPSIKITLYAILNKPSQLEGYRQQLKQYGQEAIDWIKSKSVNPDKLSIIWAPSNPLTN